MKTRKTSSKTTEQTPRVKPDALTAPGADVLSQSITPQFAAYHGDSCEVLGKMPKHSVHYSIFSPPFASLYTYSNSPRDLGNVRNDAEFFAHFDHVIDGLNHVMMRGRLVSLHCMPMPTRMKPIWLIVE